MVPTPRTPGFSLGRSLCANRVYDRSRDNQHYAEVILTSSEHQMETELIQKLTGLKYQHRGDIRDRAALERNFREKFQSLNHVSLTDAEFQRLLEEVVTPDVFTAAHTLRNRNALYA